MRWAPLAIAGATLAAFGLVVGLDDGPLRAAGGIALTLVLPGAGVLTAARPRWQLSRWESLAFTVASSIAIVALVTVLLHATKVRIDERSWAVAVLIPILVLCAGAGIGHRRAEAPRRSAIRWRSIPARIGSRRPRPVAVVAALVVPGLLVGAIALTQASIERRDDRSPTQQLWALPDAGAPGTFTVGLSDSTAPATYIVQVSRRGRGLRRFRAQVPRGRPWSRRLQLPGVRGQLTVDSRRIRPGPELNRSVEVTLR